MVQLSPQKQLSCRQTMSLLLVYFTHVKAIKRDSRNPALLSFYKKNTRLSSPTKFEKEKHNCKRGQSSARKRDRNRIISVTRSLKDNLLGKISFQFIKYSQIHKIMPLCANWLHFYVRPERIIFMPLRQVLMYQIIHPSR